MTASEPLNVDTANIYKTTDLTNSNITLKVDGVLSFAKMTAAADKNTTTIEFLNALSNGTHVISIADAKDFAGFKVATKEFTITTAADTVAPVLSTVEYLTSTTVKVTFNEEVSIAGAAYGTPTFEVYEAGNATNKFSSIAYSATSPKEATITLASPLTVSSTVDFTVKYKNVEDMWANKTTTLTSVSSKVTDDLVKPTVAAYEVLAANVVKVTFSEKVDAAAAVAQFKLYKEDGTTVVDANASTVTNFDTTTPDGKTFKVTFSSLASINSANYKVKVTATKDLSIRQNVIDDYVFAITAKDSLAPTVSSAVITAGTTVATDKIELGFSEAMDATLLGNIANYFVGKTTAGVPLSNVTDAKVLSVSADGKKVVLQIPSATAAVTGKWSSAIDVVAVPGLKDIAGNYVSNGSIGAPIAVTASYTAITASDIKVEATGKNTIVVTAANGFTFSAADANSFKFKDASNITAAINNAELGIVASQVSADGKTITLTTAVALTADAKADSTDAGTVVEALKFYVSGTGIKDQNGQSLTIADTAAVSATHTNLADKIVATQGALVVAPADVITITFDESLVKPSGITNDILAAGFEIKNGTTTLTPVLDYTVAVNAANVVITVIKNGIVAKDLTVELKRSDYLTDTNTNAVVVKTVQTAAAVTEKVAPTCTVVKDSATQATLTFSEALDASTVILANFTGTTANSAVSLSADGKTVVLTGTYTGTNTLTVAAGVKDLAGNAITSISYTVGTAPLN